MVRPRAEVPQRHTDLRFGPDRAPDTPDASRADLLARLGTSLAAADDDRAGPRRCCAGQALAEAARPWSRPGI
ncbi:hypothetical protein ABT369_36825 [Dactylosporangium sp. NPDC000244]|uniref:hypothetical protein n=1 Tax=Dactylosporangium sp. NPDC000244 TaxID=3154365 RepID=UPI0033348484